MALIIPTEGLDYMAKLVVEGATAPASLWLGLFSDTAAAGTTVPAAGATRAVMGGTFSEANFTSYATVEMTANTDWGAVAAQTVWGNSVRGSVGVQKSFPAAGAADADANLVGFFLATHATTGVVLCYSNFDGEAADVIASLALGDIVRVTPTFGLASAVEIP